MTDLMNRLAVRETFDELNKNLAAENDEIDAKVQETSDRLNKKKVTEGDEYERELVVSVPVLGICGEFIDVIKCATNQTDDQYKQQLHDNQMQVARQAARQERERERRIRVGEKLSRKGRVRRLNRKCGRLLREKGR